MSKQQRMTAEEYNLLQRAKNLGCTVSQLPKTHPTAKRCVEDGIHFDSKTERDFYLYLKADPEIRHIDVHPTFTLPGFRFTADFITYTHYRIKVYDVKGRRPGTDFTRIWTQFGQLHPLAPLIVVRRDGKGWKEHREPPQKRDW